MNTYSLRGPNRTPVSGGYEIEYLRQKEENYIPPQRENETTQIILQKLENHQVETANRVYLVNRFLF